jgi:small-conductance mechanosensitive channel
MVAAALISGAGCKKKSETGKDMDRAATSAAKAQENVNDQAKDVAKEQKDVNKDQQDLAKDQMDVNKEQRDVGGAKADLAQARERYSVAAKQRLANIDTKLQQIESKGDASAKDTAAKLRARREEIASRLNQVGTQAEASWDTYKKDVDDSFDKLDKDVDSALNK